MGVLLVRIRCVDLLRSEYFLEKRLKIQHPIIANSPALVYLNYLIHDV